MAHHNHRRQGSVRGNPRDTLGFPAGTTLFDAQSPCRRVYLLHSGQVRLAADRGAIVEYLSRGDFFGESFLLGPRGGNLTAKCLSPVEVTRFRKSDLWDRVRRDPRFARELINSLARRLDRYQQTIQDAVVERAERRLALLLWRFLPVRPSAGWVRLRFSPSNSELAHSIGSTRWRIAHFMRRFQRLGWLERRPELWAFRERLAEFLESTARKT